MSDIQTTEQRFVPSLQYSLDPNPTASTSRVLVEESFELASASNSIKTPSDLANSLNDEPNISFNDSERASYPPSISTTIERPLKQLPPPDRGTRAYIFLFACFVIELTSWGLPAAFGVFLEYYTTHGIGKEKIPVNLAMLPWVGTLSQGLMLFLGPVLDWLLAPRPKYFDYSIYLGIIIVAMSLLASSFAKSTLELLAFQGVGFSTGAAMVSYPSLWRLNDWFHVRRGFASGFVFAGTSIGGIIFPFLISGLLARTGDATTLQVLSAASAIIMAACIPWLGPRTPIMSRKELRSDRENEKKLLRKDAMKRVWTNKRWIMFLIANLMQAFGFTLATLLLPSYAATIGLSTSAGSAALACVNASSFFTRIYVGILSDRISPHKIAMNTMIISAISVFLLWGLASVSLIPLLMFALVYGAVCGPWTALYVAMVRDVGSDDLSLTATLFGFCAFTRGIGTVLTAFVSSLLLAHPLHGAKAWTAFGVASGKYGSVVLFTGASLVVAAVTEFIALR